MSALSEVARLAAVSKATASRALSGRGYVSADAKDRVFAAAASLGYVASSESSLVSSQSRTVGVVIPHINRWYFAEVLEGIETALTAAGYELVIYRVDAERDRRKLFEYVLVRKRLAALIPVGIELSAEEVGLLGALGGPVVGIGGVIPGIRSIGIDDVAAARLVTGHLISLGHRRIVHFGADQSAETDFTVHAQRRAGFEQTMQAVGLDTRDAIHLVTLSIPGGYAAGLTLLADPRTRPTAIVAGSDEVAIGTIVAARQLGIQVPAQLSVVGIDGHELADMFGLTTIAQNPRDQGGHAVHLMLTELSADASARDTHWEPQPVRLEVRASTTAPAD